MYGYNFLQWLLFFFIYCFFGWCIESTIVSLKERKPVNRGFLKGPLLPIYGFGAITILMYTLPVVKYPILVYVMGAIGATILELFTGWAMEKILKVRYWDYTGKFLNVDGHICLECTLFWGLLGLILTYGVHKLIENLVLGLPFVALIIIDSIIAAIFISDFIVSAKAAIDLAKYLSKVDDIKKEIISAKYQLIDEADEALKELKEDAKDNFEQYKAQKAKEMDVRIAVLNEQKEELYNKIGFMKKQLLRAHPQATSKKFEGSIEDIRKYFETKRAEKKNQH